MNSDKTPRDPLLLDHDYDGIQELDNKLPRWWVWLFNLCIVFAVLYFGYYHVQGIGFSRQHRGESIMNTEYENEMRIGGEIKARAMAEFENSIATRQPSQDPAIIAAGQQMFIKNCAPCHRQDAGGLVGPNLCDDYWIHGSNFVDNLRTIWNGVPAKGMVTWKGVLTPTDIYAAASYIYTKRGSHPVNPKPPENQAPAKTGPSEFE
jgi:cytochrome c oxidase cbb3-type subunit III